MLHSSSNIEITNRFNYVLRFNGFYSRDNLPEIKDGIYVRILNNKQSEGTYCASLFIDRNRAAYFDSFRIEFILQDVLSKIKDRSITRDTFRIC